MIDLPEIDWEFWNGYVDGRDATAPVPSANRSHRYRHSFEVGRAEIEGKPIRADVARANAMVAELKDQQA